MFAACSERYRQLNPVPRAEDWAGESDPLLRARRGLEEVYGYFSRTAPLYSKVYPDVDEIPELKTLMEGFDGYLRSLAEALASAWPSDLAAGRRLVVLRHAVRFATWQSFESLQVHDAGKARLIMEWLAAPPLSAPHATAT